jgi:ubiquinone/menaquinone biosynthesis C-methylase UbiE
MWYLMEKNTRYTKNIYNKYAKEYSKSMLAGRFFNNYIEMPAVKKAIKNIKGKKVLDVGCSIGAHSKIFSTKGAKVYGIDISEEMIKIAKSRVLKGNFRVADMKKLPFKNNTFDLVFYGLSLHYIQDVKQVMKEAYRVLKKKGRLLISTHNPCATGQKRIKVQGKKIFIVDDYFGTKMEQWDMVPGMLIKHYVFTLERLFNPIMDAGFALTHITETRPIPSGKKIDPVHYKQTMKRPSFIIIEAKK